MKANRVVLITLLALLSAPVVASTASDRAHSALMQPLSSRVTYQKVPRAGAEIAIDTARGENRLNSSDALTKAKFLNQQPFNEMKPYRPWQREKSTLMRRIDS